MDLTIASFDAISEVNMKDERLAFSHEDEVLTLSGDFAEKIWVPDTFFANDKNSYLHDVTERNKLVRLNGDGSITYGMRFTTTLACMMDLHYYPLDSQNCTVEIESYGYTVMDVVMCWKNRPVRGVEEAELPQFTIIGYETNDRKERLATVNYTYWGARAKKKSKKTKEDDQKTGRKKTNTCDQTQKPPLRHEDIIELGDIRMSPLPSIRNRKLSIKLNAQELDSCNFPPSFRYSRASGYMYTCRQTPGLRFRGTFCK
ncbi:hypothetical protein YQE_01519, partial [Dendroctonus ponderosae]